MTKGSHYTVLARRFRPQAFHDVVGQEHVSDALRNAIKSGRVAHAYLFTGARGVGKTSTARILAKALNCPNVTDGVPCNDCEICDGISAGNDVDVLEIDGASNRGIDDIRSLRANVNVRSMRTQFKLYIIDEVHMLTREAFNALLKTLEEPPPNVKFVFCTTEPNKVPDTILSRCQRFDFSAIGDESIGIRLKEIAAAEGFEVEDEAVDLVARRARGSMRDSQSLFDQLLAFSDGTVQAADVHRMLGTASDDMLSGLFEAVTHHRPGEVLDVIDAAISGGVQTGELLDQCISYVRDMMVSLSDGSRVALMSVSSQKRAVLDAQAAATGLPNVMAAFQILSEAKSRMFRSTFARVLLEMALVQISMLENLSALSNLLSGRLPGLAQQSTDPESAGGSEKKNSEIPRETVAEVDSDSQISRPKLEFRPENAAEILSEIISETAFTLSSAMRSVQSIAISGPNAMELFLSGAYDFQRRVIEQPESRAAIQSIVSRLTGVEAAISLKSLPQAESPRSTTTDQEAIPASSGVAVEVPARSEKTTEPKRGKIPLKAREDIDPESDSFVQQVVSVFGATVVKITDAPVRKNQHTSDEPAD